MGMAFDYRPHTIAPFVESLVSPGIFRGEAVIFVKETNVELIAYLRSRKVTVAVFDSQRYAVTNLYLARWLAFLDRLEADATNGREYDNILLTDVRDVTFQKPLFGTPCGDLEVHYEADVPRIGDCPFKSRWVRDAFGEEALVRLASSRISCCGTVSGRMPGVLRYLTQIRSLILGLPDAMKHGRSGDQGIHNYLVHGQALAGMTILENFQRVATLHYVDGASLHANPDGCVVNPDGEISELAHQWDRHPHLAAAIAAKALERQTRAGFLNRLRRR